MTATATHPNTNQVYPKDAIVNRRLFINRTVMSADYVINIERILENTKGALTTTYGDDLEGQLNKAIQKYSLSKEQDSILRSLTEKLIGIEKSNSVPFNLNLDYATDNEIIISRKGAQGVGLISIDPYGSIMVHFAGYTDGEKINFYNYTGYDAEAVVFDFLHP